MGYTVAREKQIIISIQVEGSDRTWSFGAYSSETVNSMFLDVFIILLPHSGPITSWKLTRCGFELDGTKTLYELGIIDPDDTLRIVRR